MSEPLPPLVSAARSAWPLDRWRDVTVLIGVSGGADSVALLRALHELRRLDQASAEATPPRGSLIVAHFQHGTRPGAAEDAVFVERLAAELGLPFVSGQRQAATLEEQANAAEVAGAKSPPHAEESLRQARYAFFIQAARQQGARYVALAHTADDQAETVLHRIIRGTGLRGLAGIPFARGLVHGVTIVRPLLAVSRADVLNYLKSVRQAYRVDPTNADENYTRNALRHSLIPQLEARFNPRVREALARLAAGADEALAALDELAEQALAAGVLFPLPQQGVDQVALNRTALRNWPDDIVRRVGIKLWERQGWPLQGMGDVHWRRFTRLVRAELFHAQTVSEVLPGDIHAQADAERLTLRRRAASS